MSRNLSEVKTCFFSSKISCQKLLSLASARNKRSLYHTAPDMPGLVPTMLKLRGLALLTDSPLLQQAGVLPQRGRVTPRLTVLRFRELTGSSGGIAYVKSFGGSLQPTGAQMSCFPPGIPTCSRCQAELLEVHMWCFPRPSLI